MGQYNTLKSKKVLFTDPFFISLLYLLLILLSNARKIPKDQILLIMILIRIYVQHIFCGIYLLRKINIRIILVWTDILVWRLLISMLFCHGYINQVFFWGGGVRSCQDVVLRIGISTFWFPQSALMTGHWISRFKVIDLWVK